LSWRERERASIVSRGAKGVRSSRTRRAALRMTHPPTFRSRVARPALFALGSLLCGSACALFVLKLQSEQGFLVDLKASQIGVRIDAWSGERTLISTPGYHLLLPGLQQIALFERSPIDLKLEAGNAQAGVPAGPTTVRSSDGSKFWFESLEVQHQLQPEHAVDALAAFGAARDRQQQLVGLLARAALGREYGRLAAHEVADPATIDTVKLECKRRMRDGLAPYGIELIQVTMPKPRFEREYERAIDERQLASQALDKVQGDLATLVAARPLRLEKVDRELLLAGKSLEVLGVQKLAQAESVEIARRAKTDAWALARRSEGESKSAELLANATARRESAVKSAEGLRAEVAALASAGDIAVRDVIIQRLGSIEFTLSPFQQDPQPSTSKGGQ
jgi:regulator of protease activity HflC (stomatin/prohibitin superfamily)